MKQNHLRFMKHLCFSLFISSVTWPSCCSFRNQHFKLSLLKSNSSRVPSV